MAERGGRTYLKTIENSKSLSIRPILEARLHPDTDKVVTDSAEGYSTEMPPHQHEKGEHKEELRYKGFISSTRTIESAFSLFKRGIMGSYHKMSRDHIDSRSEEHTSE